MRQGSGRSGQQGGWRVAGTLATVAARGRWRVRTSAAWPIWAASRDAVSKSATRRSSTGADAHPVTQQQEDSAIRIGRVGCKRPRGNRRSRSPRNRGRRKAKARSPARPERIGIGRGDKIHRLGKVVLGGVSLFDSARPSDQALFLMNANDGRLTSVDARQHTPRQYRSRLDGSGSNQPANASPA